LFSFRLKAAFMFLDFPSGIQRPPLTSALGIEDVSVVFAFDLLCTTGLVEHGFLPCVVTKSR